MPTDRRTFLKLAFTSAAGGIADFALAQEGKTGCGLAIGTYGLQSLSLEEAIQIIAATGYNALEITSMPASRSSSTSS